MHLGNDFGVLPACFPEDTVASDHQVIRFERVIGAQLRDLTEGILDRCGWPIDKAGPVLAAGLSRYLDSLVAKLLQTRREESGEQLESTHRIAQFDRPRGQPVQFRRLPRLAPQLAGVKVAKRRQPL